MEQSEALKLAKTLDERWADTSLQQGAATELRRLHEVNQIYKKALQYLEKNATKPWDDEWCGDVSREALQKAEQL